MAEVIPYQPETSVVDPSDPEGILEGLLPYYPEDNGKSKYLSFRSVGFGVNDSCSLTGVSYRTVMRWRADDPDFRRLDTSGIGKLRDDVGNNYLRLEWSRNFRLALEKDRQVLEAAARKQPLSSEDRAYLKAIRNQYTPAALEALERILLGSTSDDEGFDLTKFVLAAARDGRTTDVHVHVEG